MHVQVAGRSVELTPTEFQLLVTLARRPGQIRTRSQLLDAVHGVAFESYERAIDTHIKNLRRKIEPDSADPPLHPDRPRHRLPVRGRAGCLTSGAGPGRAAAPPAAMVAGRTSHGRRSTIAAGRSGPVAGTACGRRSAAWSPGSCVIALVGAANIVWHVIGRDLRPRAGAEPARRRSLRSSSCSRPCSSSRGASGASPSHCHRWSTPPGALRAAPTTPASRRFAAAPGSCAS